MQKIFLRAWQDQVVDELFLVLLGKDVYRFIPSCPPDSASQLAAKLRPEGLIPPLVFSVHLEEPGDPVVGLVSVHPDSLGHWNLGFMIGQAHWGKGIGKEAVRLVLLEVQLQIGPQRVVARVDSQNTASLRALKANGFVELARIETMLKFKASVDVELERNV